MISNTDKSLLCIVNGRSDLFYFFVFLLPIRRAKKV